MWIYEKWEGPCVVTIFEKKLILLLLVSFVDKRNGNGYMCRHYFGIFLLLLWCFSLAFSLWCCRCSRNEVSIWKWELGWNIVKKRLLWFIFCNNSTKIVRGAEWTQVIRWNLFFLENSRNAVNTSCSLFHNCTTHGRQRRNIFLIPKLSEYHNVWKVVHEISLY